jgi:hypothetical protein
VTFGKDMTWFFPDIAKEEWKKDVAGENHDVYVNIFKVGNRSIPVYSLPHPSGNKFNMRIYHQYFIKNGIAF